MSFCLPKTFGINYDPSHFVWQQIDYLKPLYEFKDRIYHVHFKDIKLFPEKLREVGVMAYPLDFMSPKLPGLGDVDWGKYVSALTDIGYDGYACIEVEDRAFEGSRERILRFPAPEQALYGAVCHLTHLLRPFFDSPAEVRNAPKGMSRRGRCKTIRLPVPTVRYREPDCLAGTPVRAWISFGRAVAQPIFWAALKCSCVAATY